MWPRLHAEGSRAVLIRLSQERTSGTALKSQTATVHPPKEWAFGIDKKAKPHMFDIKRKSIEWGGRKLTLETGRIARQADGAVLAT